MKRTYRAAGLGTAATIAAAALALVSLSGCGAATTRPTATVETDGRGIDTSPTGPVKRGIDTSPSGPSSYRG